MNHSPYTGHPFFRSYGVILPSSLRRVLPRALARSVPAYLCRFAVRAPRHLTARLFLAAWAQPLRRGIHPSSHSPLGVGFYPEERICLPLPPTGLARDIHHPVGLPFCVPPRLQAMSRWGRNVDRLSIGYAFRPRLRSRLTLSGRPFLKNP